MPVNWAVSESVIDAALAPMGLKHKTLKIQDDLINKPLRRKKGRKNLKKYIKQRDEMKNSD